MRVSTEAALAARHRTAEAAIRRVHDAITRLRREKAQPSVAAVARRAGVSRSFIYGNPEARTAVATALAEACERRVQLLDGQDDEREATLRERALNAEDALKAAHVEITTQRTRIGELLGQVRDLESEWTMEAVARITTENTTLKQRVRQLAAATAPWKRSCRPSAPATGSPTAGSRRWKPSTSRCPARGRAGYARPGPGRRHRAR
jgi:small-conductance mechanosensitive channel